MIIHDTEGLPFSVFECDSVSIFGISLVTIWGGISLWVAVKSCWTPTLSFPVSRSCIRVSLEAIGVATIAPSWFTCFSHCFSLVEPVTVKPLSLFWPVKFNLLVSISSLTFSLGPLHLSLLSWPILCGSFLSKSSWGPRLVLLILEPEVQSEVYDVTNALVFYHLRSTKRSCSDEGTVFRDNVCIWHCLDGSVSLEMS